jgi:hypothetical protein
MCGQGAVKIPPTHRLSELEVKLLEAVQKLLRLPVHRFLNLPVRKRDKR